MTCAPELSKDANHTSDQIDAVAAGCEVLLQLEPFPFLKPVIDVRREGLTIGTALVWRSCEEPHDGLDLSERLQVSQGHSKRETCVEVGNVQYCTQVVHCHLDLIAGSEWF